MVLDKLSEKKAKVASLLRAIDRILEGDMAIGGLLLSLERLMPSLPDEPWHRELATDLAELKDRYDAPPANRGPPTTEHGDVTAVIGRLHQHLRSYLAELQMQSGSDSASAGVDVPLDDGMKSVVTRIAVDPKHTLLRVEVVIGTEGQGGVSATFFELSGEHDRNAQAGLLRQAAEMLLEHAETMRNRPDRRRRRAPD